MKKINCQYSANCKNYAREKCYYCNQNAALPKIDNYYDCTLACWCCNNKNVIVGRHCPQCNAIV